MAPPAAEEEKLNLTPEQKLAAQIQPFLDEWFYRIVNSPVGKMWGRQKALGLLMDVFGMVGIKISEGDKLILQKSDDADETPLVEAIIAAMPGDQRDKFESTALQIQTILHEATRILAASEADGDDSVAELFDEDGSVGAGLSQQVLKASVVYAAKEVAQLRKVHTSWRKNTDARIDRLLKATEEAEHLQQQLLAAEAQLSEYQDSAKSKAKGALMSMAEGNDSALVHSIFSGWLGFVEKCKAEAVIRKKFTDQIALCEKRLFDFKEQKIANIKAVLMKGVMEDKEVLMHMVWKCWMDDVNEHKADGDTAAQLQAVKDKMASFEQSQRENAGKFMTRMASGNDESLKNLCLESWIKHHQDYAMDREMEEKVKEAERKFKEHMDLKKDEAKQVLDRMLGATDHGLMSLVMQNWQSFVKDENKQAELEFAMSQANDKFKSLNGRQKGAAHGAQNRVNEQMNNNLMQRIWNNWTIETKANRVETHYKAKYETKKKQLTGIQQLFKSFAMQLEQNLGGDDDSSSRNSRRNSNRSRHGKGLTKGAEGSVSLPDIHQQKIVA